MEVTLFIVLVGSILYALVFTPAIGSRFGSLGIRKSKTLENAAVLENGDPTEIDGVTGLYAKALTKIIQSPAKFIVFVIFTVVTIFMLYGQHAPGSRFFIEEEPMEMEVKIEGRGSFAELEKLGFLKEIENIVLSIPGPSSISLNMNGVGDPRERGNSDEIGTIFIEMPFEKDLRRSGWDVYDELLEKTKDIPGLVVNAKIRENGPPTDSPIEIDVFGKDFELVKEASIALTRYMKDSVPGAKNVYNTIPTNLLKWTIKIDKEKAKQFGVTTQDIGAAIQFMTAGVKVGEYRPADLDEEVDIRVRFPADQRRLDQFDDLTVNTRFGQAPLSSFVQIVPAYIPPSIRRVSGERAFTVAAEYAKGALVEDVIPKIEQWISDNNEYERLQFRFGGQQAESDANSAFFLFAFIVGIFLMSILLMVQLNSFYQVFIIVSAVILSTAGVQLGLLVTQQISSALFTSLGVIALAGIVVNNNIVLVDTYNVITKENPNLSREQIVIRTAAQRLRPIILTTATTVIGLLPLASGIGVDFYQRDIEIGGRVSEWWQPMSFAVVCGLSFASVITLFLTPCWLMLPVKIRESINKLKTLFVNSASER
ncbi:MAG: efflux RND transporter permease subunit [Gammaproteobacteria bacterium]